MDQTGLWPQVCGGHSDPHMLLRLETSDVIAHQALKDVRVGSEGSSFITVSKKTYS